MNAKRYAWGLMGMLAMMGPVSAQSLSSPEPPTDSPISEIYQTAPTPPQAPASVMPQMGTPSVSGSPTGVPSEAPVVSSNGYAMPGVTNWVSRARPCCNYPFGRDPEIGSELYFRVGPSIPIGDGAFLSRNLATGFTVQGGLRTLFYNNDYTRAWTIDGGMSNTFNSANRDGERFNLPQLNNRPLAITIRDVNRTFVNLGGGHEWFHQPAKDNPAHWRWGVDAGARYGTMKASPSNFGHLTDVIGGAYTGAHVMYECYAFDSIINFGLRTEYSYTWSDVFKRQSDVSEINILVNFGVRY